MNDLADERVCPDAEEQSMELHVEEEDVEEDQSLYPWCADTKAKAKKMDERKTRGKARQKENEEERKKVMRENKIWEMTL